MDLQKLLQIAREKPKTIAMRPFETPETKYLGRRCGYRATVLRLMKPGARSS